MNRKFVLTLILAVVMISVIAFSACGVALAEEGVIWDRFDAEDKKSVFPAYPRLDEDKTTPGFGEYVTADGVKVNDGYTLKPITGEMDAWTAYQTMRENQKNVIEKAQVTTTAARIDIQITEASGIFSIVNKKNFDVVVNASWMSAKANGSYYNQNISQMGQIGVPALESLTSMFGVWSKSSYNAATDIYSYQAGDKGSMTSDDNAPAGITANWLGTPETWHSSDIVYDESVAKFDRTVRVTSNVDGADYKVYTGDDEKLGNDYRSSKNTKNNDSLGNKVIYVEFKGSDGKFGDGKFYVWDENYWDYDQNKFVPQYVGFDRDRHYKALPSRGDGISNYMVTDDTFDMTKSKITAEKIDGHTYYVIDVVLTDAVVDWDIITGGELGSLQGSIIDFVAFDTEHGGFQRELTLRYEVWDTGVIRRAIRTYSIATDDQDGSGSTDEQILALGAATAYGSATNNQIQEFAYTGDTLDLSSPMYGFEKGALLDKLGVIGVCVGVGAAVLIALIVTLVVLAKKGIIGKKKNKKAAETAGEGADAENKE